MVQCSFVLYFASSAILAWIVFVCIMCVCICQGKLIIDWVHRGKVCPQSKQNLQSTKQSKQCEHALKQQDIEQELSQVKTSLETLHKQFELVKSQREDAFGRIDTLRSELETEREDVRKRIRSLTSELQIEREEKEEALKRLSSIMSSRLRDGNPNVADLNDQNRPVKIGEQFSELYNNQWTDAYDAVEKHFGAGTREDVIIKLLLDILEQCFMLCKEEGEKQLHVSSIRQNVSIIATHITKKATNLPEDLMQRIKEIRKLFAIEELPRYDKALSKIKENISHLSDVLDSCELKDFVNECVKLCWLMLVQDPPMTIILKPARNEIDKFKAYKSRGNDVAFVVWPALLLKEWGAVLQKGIAEFCDSSTNDQAT